MTSVYGARFTSPVRSPSRHMRSRSGGVSKTPDMTGILSTRMLSPRSLHPSLDEDEDSETHLSHARSRSYNDDDFDFEENGVAPELEEPEVNTEVNLNSSFDPFQFHYDYERRPSPQRTVSNDKHENAVAEQEQQLDPAEAERKRRLYGESKRSKHRSQLSREQQNEARQWLIQAAKLRHQVRLLEKVGQGSIFRTNNKIEEVASITKTKNKHVETRKTEEHKILASIKKIKLQVKKFSVLVMSDPDPKLSAEEYENRVRGLAQNIEDLIEAFKQQQRATYTQLLRQTNELEDELGASSKRFEAWEAGEEDGKSAHGKSMPDTNKASVLKAKLRKGGDLPPEMENVQALIDADGGRTGGWDDRDHSQFLKLYTQTQSRATLINRIIQEIPEQTEQSAVEHIQWYRRHLLYEKRKKELINEWREKQQQEESDRLEAEKAAQEEVRLREEREELAKQKREHAVKAAAVKEWQERKRIKEATINRLNEERRKLEIARENQKRAAEQERRAKEKARLEEAKQRKQAEKDALDDDEQALRAQIAREQRERTRYFHQKQREQIAKLAERRQQLEQERLAKQERLAQLISASEPEHVHHVAADPNRLTQHTAASQKRAQEKKKERIRAKNKDSSSISLHNAGPSYSTARITAVPSWRHGLYN